MSQPRYRSDINESLRAFANTPRFRGTVPHATPRLAQSTETRPCLQKLRSAAGPTAPAPR
eukprot:1766688-Alexandrium_andersonii.AAC.1